MEHTIETTIKLIESKAGKARVRTVDGRDLYQVLQEAQSDIWGYRSGSTVANCYGYRADRMRLLAVRRTDGDYCVWVDWGPAKKGCSPIPDALPRQYGKSNSEYGEALRRVADHNPAENDSCDARLSQVAVNHALRQRREQAREHARSGIQWSSDWNGRVTRQHSIDAGNCPRETDRIIAQLRHTRYVTAKRLREWITRHAPELATYADRAITQAQLGIEKEG